MGYGRPAHVASRSRTAFLSVEDGITGEVHERLEIAIGMLDDYRPLWRRVRPAWHRSRRVMYMSGGSSTGAPWPTYEQTGERHVYRWVKGEILGRRMTRADLLRWDWPRERLRPSLVHERHRETVWREGKRALELGTSVPYARDHDAGRGRAPRWAGGHAIPRRPILRLGRQFIRDIAEEMGIMAAEVAAVIGPRGGRRVRAGQRVGLSSGMVGARLRGGG